MYCPDCGSRVPNDSLFCDKCGHEFVPGSGPKAQRGVVRTGTSEPFDTVYTMRGVGEILHVYKDKVDIIPKGVIGLMTKGLKGTKTLFFSFITGIQFKKSGITSGYLQFTVPGGVESRGGVIDAVKDENTFMFSGQNELAQEIKSYIEGRIQEIRMPKAKPSSISSGTSLADELQKLADLKKNGILSEEEFQAAKKRLLG